MKKRIGIIALGLALSLGACLGINQNIKKASAYNGISGPTIHAEFDSSAAIFYSNVEEQTSVTVADMDSVNDGYFTFDDANAKLEEVSANRYFRAALLPARFYVNLDAHTEASFAQFSIDIMAYKINNTGGANSIIELFSQKPATINGYANTTPSDENSLGRAASGSTTKAHAFHKINDYTFSNNSDSNQNIYLSGTYYVAYIIKYASSVDHVGAADIDISDTYCTKYGEIGGDEIKIDFDDSNALYYQQSGSDLNSVNYSDLSPIPNENDVYTSNFANNTYVLKEATMNKKFDVVLIPFRFYLPVNANETVSFSSLHINLTIRKLSSGGSAGAFVELFDGEPALISTASNDTLSPGGLIRKNTISAINDETNIFARVGVERDLLGESFVNSTNEAKNIYSNRVYYLMFGCRYASTYDHQAEVTIQINGTKGTSDTEYVCRVGNTYYETIADAIAAGSTTSNNPLVLIDNLSSSNCFFPISISTKRVYLNLNGYSINAGNNVAISISQYLDLYGSGLIVSSAVHTVETATNTNVVLTAGSNITIRNEYVGAETSVAYYQPSGNFTMNGGLIEGGDYGIWFTGNTITINGGSVSGNLYSLYTTRGLALGGATTSVPTIYEPAIDSMRINLAGGSSAYSNTNSTITVTLKNNEDIAAEKVVFAGVNNSTLLSTLSVTNGVGTGLEYYYNSDQRTYGTRYTPYNIIFNGTNCTMTGNTTGHYGASYNGSIVPATGYTYPESIEILMGSEPLAANEYSYKSNTGNFSIKTNIILDTITINAAAVSATYNITFSSNGGSGSMSNMSGGYNEVIILPSCSFTRNYRTFLEWNTLSDGNGDSYAPGDEYTVTVNTTLYAIWYESNGNKVDYFVDNYMRMTTYTQSNGSCLGSNGYYAQAKAALIALGEDCIQLFQEDAKYNAAQERYETWAGFNNDTANMYVDTPVNAAAKTIISSAPTNSSVIITVVVVALLSASFIIFYIKRKNNE